jgi:hypothetical protein
LANFLLFSKPNVCQAPTGLVCRGFNYNYEGHFLLVKKSLAFYDEFLETEESGRGQYLVWNM